MTAAAQRSPSAHSRTAPGLSAASGLSCGVSASTLCLKGVIMSEVTVLFLEVLRQAWVALAGSLGAVACLALLAQVLRAAGGTALSARFWTWQAISGGAATLILALFGLLGAPALSQAVQRSLPGGGGCGPVADLGVLAASLIAALAALRLLRATFAAVVMASAGGSAPLSGMLLEAAEAVFGMALAAAATPLSAHFLGAC